jgi:response regulator RpfG family c-di-GMP phosphodiesterase
MLTLTAQLWRANYPYTDNLALSCMILLDEVKSDGVMKEITSSSKTNSKIKLKEKHAFDAQAFLDSAGLGRIVEKFRGKETVFAQGDPAKNVMHIQEGGVKRCDRLSKYSVALGEKLRLSEDLRLALRRGGLIHDIGKLSVPEHILLKPGPLTPEERKIMEQHTIAGERICVPLRSFRRVLPIIRTTMKSRTAPGTRTG